MSYYYSHQFQFSTHGLQRIKERLNIKHMDDFQAKDHCIKLLENHGDYFEDRNFRYYQVLQKNLYFVVQKDGDVIVTLTPISPSKMLKLLEQS